MPKISSAAHPEFRPTLISGWNGDRPQLRRASLAQRPQEASGLKFPHALHLAKQGGAAQMARRLGMGQALDCADCHRPEPTGARFLPSKWSGICAMCHSLDFARSGGTIRTLRHGEPAQVVAELRISTACGRAAARRAFRPLHGANRRDSEPAGEDPVRAGRAPADRGSGHSRRLFARRRLLRLPHDRHAADLDR
jgi:hypothetical protein